MFTLKIIIQTPGVSVDEGGNDSATVYKIDPLVIVVIVLGKFCTTSSRTSNNK